MMSPTEALQAAFERIAATRMRGLPLNNPALSVASVGFVPWGDVQVGVLITPWAINLAVVAEQPATLALAVDQRQTWRFPSGEYELMGGNETECGPFQFCSLFSPAFEFDTQDAATATAHAIMAALMLPEFVPEVVTERDAASGEARPPRVSFSDTPLSRRGFLRNVLVISKP